MKDRVTLTVASLLTIALLVLHLAIEIVHRVESGQVSTFAGILVLGVWMYGALPLADRRSGVIIMLVGGILGVGISILHMRGTGLAGGRIGGTSDALLWVSSLLALSLTATFSVLLAARGLFRGTRFEARRIDH